MYKSFHNPELTKRLTVVVSQEFSEASIRIQTQGIHNPDARVQIIDEGKFLPAEIKVSSGTITPDFLDDLELLKFCHNLVQRWWQKGYQEEDIIHGVSTTFIDYIENK